MHRLRVPTRKRFEKPQKHSGQKRDAKSYSKSHKSGVTKIEGGRQLLRKPRTAMSKQIRCLDGGSQRRNTWLPKLQLPPRRDKRPATHTYGCAPAVAGRFRTGRPPLLSLRTAAVSSRSSYVSSPRRLQQPNATTAMRFLCLFLLRRLHKSASPVGRVAPSWPNCQNLRSLGKPWARRSFPKNLDKPGCWKAPHFTPLTSDPGKTVTSLLQL